MIIRLSKNDRRYLESINAILAASSEQKTKVDCGPLAAVIATIDGQDDDELKARISNAHHAVTDLYSDPYCEPESDTENIDYAMACIPESSTTVREKPPEGAPT
ncbi:hypothetical protein [Agrobacterium pusense]|uniref:hypothetical protein n=1 Tax=Agrobacterium pusense TaxID=648995 RepID=UPI000D3C7C88|nr:hypothetical protein [Agrobacterium pusense]PTV70239.1 hypothetical protein DBL06_25585 [Agrobacterium pusense]